MLYILLPVHNRREITRRFINCLKSQTFQDFHLVLIDDGSRDGTSEMVTEALNKVTIIKGQGNWWWAGSLQQGYAWLQKAEIAPDDTVAIFNDDTEFDQHCLQRGVGLVLAKHKAIYTAECYSRQDGRLMDRGIHVDWSRLAHEQAQNANNINCLSTRGLFIKASDFLALGGFYPRLLPHYASDYEFTIRAHRKGFTLSVDPTLKLTVDETTTGCRKIDNKSLSQVLGSMFSKRSVLNPWYWSVYVALSCPWRWKLLNWTRIWRNAAWNISSSVRLVRNI